MANMGDGYGSEWHLLRYLGRHRTALNEVVLESVGAQEVYWLDFHFDPGNPWLDGERKGLDFLPPNSPTAEAWKRAWPTSGSVQNWDAVARLSVRGQPEWLLIEAKANIQELQSHCSAKPEGGLTLIQSTLEATQNALQVDKPVSTWLGPYYQLANRLAVLHFLNSRGEPTRLLYIYFTGDRGDERRTCPKTKEDWMTALSAQDEHLGISGSHKASDRIHKVFLPVCQVSKG